MATPLTEPQLTILAAIRFAGMHYIRDSTAWLASPPFATLHLASVRRLLRDDLVRPSADDDDVFEVSPTGHEALRFRPDLVAAAGRAEASHEVAAFVTDLRRTGLMAQDTAEQRSRILEDLTEQLRDHGSVFVEVSSLTVPVVTWRKLAREASKTLGRPIETAVTGHRISASLRDWPSTPEETAILQRRMRAAIERQGAAE